MIDPVQLRREFSEAFGGEARLFRAPGRVNLIGEHTDYNGGFVLPMAIDREAAIAIRSRPDRVVRVRSANFDESAEFRLDDPSAREKGEWINYFIGVAAILEREGVRLSGADLVIRSDVPGGAGLSSSAALEIAFGLSITEISAQKVDRKLLAKAGQLAEHEFVGAKVGIMDQFVSAHARRGHALFLDCRSLEYEHLPLDTSDVAVVLCDTNVKHEIAATEYNTRRAECDEAVAVLKEKMPGILELRDVSVEDLDRYGAMLEPTILKRARHVVTENARVQRAVEMLNAGDLAGFGELMWQSHRSLRDDYEVSCRELDILVEIASAAPGVLGGRMTGGGFGGSTVNLVQRDRLAHLERQVRSEYPVLSGLQASILVSDACAGAGEIP
jgi:galactokinase